MAAVCYLLRCFCLMPAAAALATDAFNSCTSARFDLLGLTQLGQACGQHAYENNRHELGTRRRRKNGKNSRSTVVLLLTVIFVW